jgi:hypothetical protein
MEQDQDKRMILQLLLEDLEELGSTRAKCQYLIVDGNLQGLNIVPQARDGNFKICSLSSSQFSLLSVF